MSRSNKLSKSYKIIPLISGVILLICFIFRYSYIDFLGFDRPLKLASFYCTLLGVAGLVLALIDGVNKEFRGKIFRYLIINILFIFTFPILVTAEKFKTPVINPFAALIPETEYSTRYKKNASFILEGKLYEWPLTFSDFLANGFDYRNIEGNKYSLSKRGKADEIKPTWFTDGMRSNLYFSEYYNLEVILDGKGDIENQNVEELKIRGQRSNWDFEIMGIPLLEYTYKVEEKFGDELIKEERDNSPIQTYSYLASDGYTVRFGSFQGNIVYIEIEK